MPRHCHAHHLSEAPGWGRAGAAALLALALVAGKPAAAQDAAVDAAAAEAVGPKLPQRVRGILLEEMAAVLGATQQILDALVRGEDATVAEQAQAIHDSFILEQEMTDADRQALLAAVPSAFVERDQAFHQLAADLAAAGRDGDDARQHELFQAMVEACAGCHARYATNLFPGFDE